MFKNRDQELQEILSKFDIGQWIYKQDVNIVSSCPVIDRKCLRNTKMQKHLYACKTSGSTGEPVTVEKTEQDWLWYMATNIREFLWRKWDFTKNVAVIRGDVKVHDQQSWGLPDFLAPVQGKRYLMNFAPIREIQKWLEEKNPHYIQCYPSIVKQLDLSKITNLIDVKGTGECGASMFSSEECGTIAIQCPDNRENYHVMENQIVEVDSNNNMIISTMTNPYIRRYKNGDCIELGECTCGRTLQTITKIYGRVRNMFVLPNGDKKWPLIGSRDYYDKFGIKRFKAIQKSLTELELQIICNPLGDRESELKKLVLDWLNSPVNVTISYVDSFPHYKHEEFVSLVNNHAVEA